MKKQIFTVTLALSLAAAMATGAFADAAEITGRVLRGSPETEPLVYAKEQIDANGYNDEDGYAVDKVLIGPFAYDSDDKNLELASVQYGETAYYLLTGLYSDDPQQSDPAKAVFTTLLLSDGDSADGLKVKVDWEEGEDDVDGVTITKKKVNQVGTYDDNDFTQDSGAEKELEKYGFTGGDYYYMVAVSVEESDSTADTDLIGTLTLDKSSSPDADEIDFDIAVNVDWEESYRKENTNYNDVSGDIDINAETYYSVKFDGDDEIEIAFEDDSTFTVDISGQSKLLLYYDTEFNADIASRYPQAELNFWNGNGAKFNRTGELFLSTGDDADYAQFLYQINSDGSLSEVAGAEYDDSDEGFYFKTRTLGSYVYSDMELELSSSDSEEESDGDDLVVTPVAPVTPVNPGTGARA